MLFSVFRVANMGLDRVSYCSFTVSAQVSLRFVRRKTAFQKSQKHV